MKLRRAIPVAISLSLGAVAISLVDLAQLGQSLITLPPWVFAGILVFFLANLVVVSFRLHRILHSLGVFLNASIVARASISGHLAGLLLTSLFGQIVGRHSALRKFGVSPVMIASVTTIERMVILTIGGSLFLAGIYVLGTESAVLKYVRQVPYVEISLIIAVSLGLSLSLGRSSMDRFIRKNVLAIKPTLALVESLGITLVAQSLVLGGFALGAMTLNPDADLVHVIAASAVVGFAASMPIAINGWGIREIASIYIFGSIGVSSGDALALSVTVGVCSTLAILIMSALILPRPSDAEGAETSASDIAQGFALSRTAAERYSAYIVGCLAACFLFFQLHVDVNLIDDWQLSSDPLVGTININMADPIAFIAFAALLMHAISLRRLPTWRTPHLSLALIVIGLMLGVGFIIGWSTFGLTQWALMSRLFGWLVLLGYVALGYLLVYYCGRHMVKRVVETMFITGTVITVAFILFRLAQSLGYDIGGAETYNFEGFTGNRNAFAFQTLACMAMAVGYSVFYARAQRFRATGYPSVPAGVIAPILSDYRRILMGRSGLVIFCIAVLAISLLLSGSRTGIITGAVIVSVAWLFKLGDRRLLEISALVAAAIWWSPAALEAAIRGLAVMFPSSIESLQPFLDTAFDPRAVTSNPSGDTSQLERMEAIRRGLGYWTQAPIFGNGLGYFLHHSTDFFDKPVLLHNTPVWLLTEFGLAGLALVSIIFLSVFMATIKRRQFDGAARALVVLMIAVAFFCMAHDIFYQRIFWFSLGLLAAGTFHIDQLRDRGDHVSCHVITGLGAGGAERMLTRLMCRPSAPRSRRFVVSLMNEGVFGPQIARMGVPVYTLGISRENPSPLAIWRFFRILMKEKPNVIMTWLYHADLLGLLLGCFVGVRRIIWNVRCSDMSSAGRGGGFRVLMRALSTLSGAPEQVLVNSQAGKDYHASIGYHPKAWRIIGNGVDVDVFRPDPAGGRHIRDELGIPPNAPVIGHVARFHPMKDYETLLTAVSVITTENKDAHFILVGREVTWDNHFFAEWAERGLPRDRVHLIGGRTDIPAVMNAFDVFVLSSAFGEGAPNVIIESMACGVPGVVTDIGDSRTILGGCGRVVAARDPGGLATALLEMASLPAKDLQQLGEAARVRVLADFDINNIHKQYQAVLER